MYPLGKPRSISIILIISIKFVACGLFFRVGTKVHVLACVGMSVCATHTDGAD